MSVPVVTAIPELRPLVHAARARRALIGFVPTMGALHAGHARLIETARAECGFVVVSIFVNPLQFDRKEDFERYASTLPRDSALCAGAGADLIFAPSVHEMYPAPSASFVEVTGVTDHFCGAVRPGHFRGVTTVVSKLFHIVDPDRAYLGEKDAQQLAAIQTMVRDLDFPVLVVAVPTVREPDGLALSSRNERLSSHQRVAAIRLYRALTLIQTEIANNSRDAVALLAKARDELQHPAIQIEYLDLADPASLLPVQGIAGPVRAMGSIWLGSTRLIDNLLCTPPDLA